MNPYINDYIETLSSVERRRVNSILEEARVSQQELLRIVADLERSNLPKGLSILKHEAGRRVEADRFQDAFSTYDESINASYAASNLVSLLLESTTNSLVSDIQALESELSALEKAINNYSFLLSDAKAFDYAYLETFSDPIGQEVISTPYLDRGGLIFNDNEIAEMDLKEGVLAISSTLNKAVSITPVMVKTNYEPYKRSDTNIEGMTKIDGKGGWRVSVDSPAPIKSELSEFTDLYPHLTNDYLGPLAIIDCIPDSPTTCDTIKLAPSSEFDIEISQVIVYHGSEGSEKRELLEAPVKINSPTSLYFPLTSVSKFRIFLRQPLYTRSVVNSNQKKDENYKDFLMQAVIENQDKDMAIEVMLQDLMAHIKQISKHRADAVTASGIPLANLEILDSYSFEDFLMNTVTQNQVTMKKELKTKISNESKAWGAINQISNSLRNEMFEKGYYSLGRDQEQSEKSLEEQDIENETQDNVNSGTSYRYAFGLKNVQLGTSFKGFKSVFVSKVLDAPSDLTEIKIKTAETNLKKKNRINEDVEITSIEYSVTNISNPIGEYHPINNPKGHWFPITPVDQDQVKGERLLFDEFGKAYFRMPASYGAPLTVYKNGNPIEYNAAEDLIGTSSQQIYGIKLNSLIRASGDIFTCDYTTAYDNSVINFEKLGGQSPSAMSVFDADGVGEGFPRSFGQISLSIKYIPWIDYSKLNAELDETYGITGYQPIIIKLDDGTTAFNFTNYVTGENLVLNSESSEYQFVNQGQSIVFNKPLDQGVRIYYQYVPCNVRFKAVLRCNDITFSSPKLDYIHLKAKTQKPGN